MAEQTLTINTLAATVITPSDVSQFSLDDIAPNIINGGGGTIVDVSGIVTLASQVAELDSEVTVLQTNVSALQEDVSGLDAAVAQAQTTATTAASTANAAVATANSAKSTAQYALKAGTAQYALQVGTAQYTLETDNALWASRATTLQYVRTDNFQYGLLEAKINAGQLTFSDLQGNELSVAGSSSGGGFNGSFVGDPVYLRTRDDGSAASLHLTRAVARLEGDDVVLVAHDETLMLGSSTASLLGGLVKVGYKLGGNQISFDSHNVTIGDPGSGNPTSLRLARFDAVSIHSTTAEGIADAIEPYLNVSSGGGNTATAQYALQAGTAQYALSVVGGSSGGGGFNGSFTGGVDLSSGGNVSLQLNGSSASLLGGVVTVGYRYDGNQIGFDYEGIRIGNPDVGPGTTLQIYQFNEVAIHGSTARGIANALSPYMSGGSGGFNGTYTGPVTLQSSASSPKSTLQLSTYELKLESAHVRLGLGGASSKLYIANNAENVFINNAKESTSLKDTILLYAGGSSGGDVSELTYDGLALISVEDGTSLFYRDANEIYINGYAGPNSATSLKDTILLYAGSGGGSSSGGGTAADVKYWSRSNADGDAVGSARLVVDLARQTFQFYTDDGGVVQAGEISTLTQYDTTYLSVGDGDTTFYGDANTIYINGNNPSGVATLKDTILMYAGSGGGSSPSGYPALTAPSGSSLYYGIVNDNTSLRFGSFGDAEGSQEEAVVEVHYDDIYVTSRGGYSGNSTLTYGVAVAPPALRFGSWNPDNSYGANMSIGLYIPNGADQGSARIAVGSFAGNDSTRVWGLMADSTTAAFGHVTHSPSGSNINAMTGITVSEQYMLLASNGNGSAATSTLKMTSSGATLSAIFTLRNDTTIIGPTEWAKLEQLAKNADALLALLNQQ